MKNLKRVRRGVRVFAPKAFNLLVIFGLVFQPVGPAGLASVALAIDEAPAAASEAPAVSDTKDEPKAAPAEEPKKEEAPAPKEEAPVKEEVSAPAPEKPAAPAVEDPAAPVADETPAATPADEPAVPADATGDEAETSQEPEVVTPTPVEEPVDGTVAASEGAESVPEALEGVPAADVEEDLSDQVCVSASGTESFADDWKLDGDRAETKDAVKPGVTYVFPLDKDVRVTFTCLPKDESKRAPLSIERIKASDIDLPEGTIAASEYAYDITTKGMDNKTFKYDLVLPKVGVEGAEVKYIEQDADEVVANEVTENELKSVDEKDVDEKDDSIEVSGLDHFTTFFIATYSDITFTVEKDQYYQGETVYVKATNFNANKYYRISINPPGNNSSSFITSCFDPSSSGSILTGSYVLAANAAVGNNTWEAESKEFDYNDCHDSAVVERANDKFSVLAAKPDLKAEKSHNPDQEIVVGEEFAWKIHVSNVGTGAAVFGDGKKVLLDELSEDATYGTPSVSNLSGVTGGTIVCAIDDEELVCEADGAVTIAAGGSFDVSFATTPTEAKTLENPRHDGVCAADPGNKVWKYGHWEYEDAVDESNENNNKCSDSVKVEEVPYEAVMICHATGNDDKYVSETPNTVGVLMGHVGDSHQKGEDIIPPVPYYLPEGQNWDDEGQAIWGNGCNTTGNLKVIKAVDDNSLPSWGFSLDGGSVVLVHPTTGEVDFGQVTLGAHMITEVGPNASYTLDTVTGTGCQKTGADTATATVAKTGTTCVFSNLVNKGTITIVKDAEPDDAQDFSFGGSFGTFSLDDDADSTLSNSKTVSGLMPGTYTVTENPTQGWTLQGMTCVSNIKSIAPATAVAPQGISLSAGESVVCTFINTKNPVCGDGIKNGAEQCDGKNGVTEGKFCTNTCQLVPVYQGGASCSEGTVPEKVGEYAIDSKDVDGVAVSLTSGQEYLFQASGTYNYDKNNAGKYADAAYGTNNNWSGTRSDIGIWGTNRGVTSILGDLGSGLGVIEWDGDTSADGDHVYQRSFTPATSSARFLISDWYSNWYGNACDNQNCMTDNAGGLKLEVFKCMSKPDIEIAKTDTPDPVSSGGILTYTLTAKNNGPIAATDVVVTDTLPAQFDLMSVAPSVGSCSDAEDTIDKDIRCELGTLANGASVTVTVKGIALGTGAISNTAEVAGNNGDTNLANNTDTERTTVNPVGDGVCRNNTTWASSVTAVNQGVLKSGAPITDPTRVVPGYALGASDGKFFSLGNGGSLVVKFADPVNDMAGTDLSFHELTNGRSNYPLEKAKVEVSSNGSDWETIGTEVTSEPSGDGVEYLDFGPTGLSAIQYVRITDTTNFGPHRTDADGYDIDAIDARCGSGTIIVEKQTNPDGSQQRFGFSPSWDEEGFLLADGEQASFALASDEYSVTENVQVGWTQTSVSCVSSLKDKEDASSISLQPGETVTCTFTNTQLTDIHGYKWDDINGNGERDCVDGVDARSIEDECQLEPLLPGWEIQLSKWNGEGYGPVSSMMTNGEEHYGWYWFEDLLPGEYRICEVQQTGWMQTYPFEGSCHTVTLPNDELLTDNAVSAPEYNFGNFKTGKISGYKWNDCDGDGNRDEEYLEESPSFLARVFGLNDSEQNEEDVCREAGIGGVTVYLDLNHNGSHDENEPSDVTDESGYYEFTGLAAGNYSVQEVVEKGWKQTNNICAGYMRSDDELAMKSLHTKGDGVDVLSGSQFDCPIGNTETPSLSIEKENDATGSLQPGATVHYKIKVTAHHNDVKGVEVTDLPPKGFTFVGGSQVASQGSLSHVYASPGIWDLGDMAAGQTITLEYDTVIALDQDPGDYKDLAYARGMSETEDPVLADDLMDADNFVGTKVAIVVPEDSATVTVPEDNERKTKEKTVKKTKYVLGASTLPMTGGGMGSVALAIVLFLSGLGLVALSRRKQLTLGGRTIALSVIGALSLMGAGTADAASLAVQMEEPEAVVSSPDFKIGFVTLDIQNRDIEVQCYKEGAASPFETHALSVGGNSGDCQVSAAVMPADGDYVFYVKAIATDGEEGGETAESEHYAVKLVSTVPGTPYDYDRDDASCMNNITFRTAADGGKTVKVELYRSLSTSFSADASTKVTEQAIGSDTVGSFSVAAPGCSNDSFYALRAVDVYGNASAFVGDKDRNVDTHTVTNTKTTVVETAGAAVGAIPVSTGGNEGVEGQVEGASTTEDEGAAAKEGSVLGDSTVMEEAGSWMGEHPWQTGFGILIIIALIAYAYRQWYNRGAQQ